MRINLEYCKINHNSYEKIFKEEEDKLTHISSIYNKIKIKKEKIHDEEEEIKLHGFFQKISEIKRSPSLEYVERAQDLERLFEEYLSFLTSLANRKNKIKTCQNSRITTLSKNDANNRTTSGVKHKVRDEASLALENELFYSSIIELLLSPTSQIRRAQPVQQVVTAEFLNLRLTNDTEVEDEVIDARPSKISKRTVSRVKHKVSVKPALALKKQLSYNPPIKLMPTLSSHMTLRTQPVHQVVTSVFTNLFLRKDTEIVDEALDFFRRPEISQRTFGPVSHVERLSSCSTVRELIDSMLDNHRGFCIGENHIDPAAKKFCIDNMEYLSREKGVKLIFIEGVSYSQQPKLDRFNLLAEQGSNLFRAVSPQPRDFCYRDGIVAEVARRNRVRVIGMDVHEKADIPYCVARRMLTMNYVCYRVMQKELASLGPDDKFIALMGSNHISRFFTPLYSEIPGVAELMECPAIDIRSTTSNKPLLTLCCRINGVSSYPCTITTPSSL